EDSLFDTLLERQRNVLREGEEVRAVSTPVLVHLARLLEGVERVLADRLEHGESRLSLATLDASDQTDVDKPPERVERGVADCFCRGERRCAGEGCEPPEEALLLVIEGPVTPVERRPHGLLPRPEVEG